jgi:hypothetical protein
MYKTITVDVAEPGENHSSDQFLDKFDLEYLIETVDKQDQTWYTRAVRDKLHKLRFT